MRRIALSFAAAAMVLWTETAHADPSAWFSVGSGYALQRDDVTKDYARASALSFTVGAGTDPTNRFVIGSVFRTTTFFSLGTDLGFAGRFATGSFARGDWGVATDLGVVARWWDYGEKGSYPLQGKLLFGAPFGVQLALGTDLLSITGERPAQGFSALLEFDFLRFTVMRQGSSERYWENPSPAGGHIQR